jgi:hypothetical protein
MSEISEIMNTELTFGVEFEPAHVLQYYYDEKEKDTHYNREVLYSKEKFETTLEKYVNYYEGLDISSCPYNLELVFGVYKYNTIREFLGDKNYHTDEIKNDIDSFNRDFVIEHKDSIRSLIRDNRDDRDRDEKYELYSDCSLKTPRVGNSKFSYTSYFENRDSIPLVGTPQITLGMNYAFFYPLMNYVKDVRNDVRLSLDIFSKFNKMDLNDVIKGFLLSIIYYCFIDAIYVPERNSYFKAAFLFKPRSNFAISYQKIKEKYPEIESNLQDIYSMLNSSYEDYSSDEITSLKVLYAYKNHHIRSSGIHIDFPEKMTPQQKYINTISILQNTENYISVVKDITDINMLYLII